MKKQIRSKQFYQSHTCEGYSATVTIEWTVPKGVDINGLGWRGNAAEDFAGDAIGYAGPIARDIVEALCGRKKASIR